MENLKINVPIFRARKLDCDEYVEGYLFKDGLDIRIKVERRFIKIGGIDMPYEPIIDPTTLAIHFPSMISSEGKKIFASLSENGKGGDCTFMQNGYNETFCWDSLNGCIVLKSRNYECRCFRNGCRNETNFNNL